jgi:hypothetical protein
VAGRNSAGRIVDPKTEDLRQEQERPATDLRSLGLELSIPILDTTNATMLQTSDTYTEPTSIPHVASILHEAAVQLVPQLTGISKGDLTNLMCQYYRSSMLKDAF